MSIFRLKVILLISALMLPAINSFQGQTTDDLLNILVKKQVLNQLEADSIRAEIALKAQKEKEKESQSKFSIISAKPFQIGGYTQARYQAFQEADKNDGADLRRIRLDIKGPVTSAWDYRLQVDFASTVKVIDAYVNFTMGDYLKVTTGQMKVPFSLENLADDSKLESIDRSQVVEALTARGKDVIGNHNGRDIGLQVFGSFVEYNKKYLIDYSLGVFNGAGINTTDNNKQKDFAGRIVFHPYTGIDIGGSYYNGYDAWGTPQLKNLVRKRFGAELKYVYESLSLQGEYISGQDGNITRNGAYGQLGYYLVSKKVQPIIKFDRYNPDVSTDKNISKIYTFGMNYFFNDWAKLQIDYLWRQEEQTQIKNDILEFQLQLSF